MRSLLRSIFASAALATASLAVPAGAADNNVLICNHFPQTVFISLGYQASDGWNSIGWWPVTSNHCSPFSVPYKQFWFYAETAWINVGNGDQRRQHWGGTRMLYIANNGGYHYSQADRRHNDSRLTGFDASIESADSNIRERLTFTQDGKDTLQETGANVLQPD